MSQKEYLIQSLDMLRINDWLMNKPRDPDATGSVWYIPACSCIPSISCQNKAAAVKMPSCALISMYEWLLLSHNEDTIHCSPPLKKTLLVALWEADSFPGLLVI